MLHSNVSKVKNVPRARLTISATDINGLKNY